MPIKTKKQLRTHYKSDLLSIGREHGLQIHAKMSKNSIVDMIFKKKDILQKLEPKTKQPSEDQIASRQRFSEMVKSKKTPTPKETLSKPIKKDITNPPKQLSKKSVVPIQDLTKNVSVLIEEPVKQRKHVPKPTATTRQQPEYTEKHTPIKDTPIIKDKRNLDKKVDTGLIDGGKTKVVNDEQNTIAGNLKVLDFKNEKTYQSKVEYEASKLNRENMDALTVDIEENDTFSRLNRNNMLNNKSGLIDRKLYYETNNRTSDYFDTYMRNLQTLKNKNQYDRILRISSQEHIEDDIDLQLALQEEEEEEEKVKETEQKETQSSGTETGTGTEQKEQITDINELVDRVKMEQDNFVTRLNALKLLTGEKAKRYMANFLDRLNVGLSERERNDINRIRGIMASRLSLSQINRLIEDFNEVETRTEDLINEPDSTPLFVPRRDEDKEKEDIISQVV